MKAPTSRVTTIVRGRILLLAFLLVSSLACVAVGHRYGYAVFATEEDPQGRLSYEGPDYLSRKLVLRDSRFQIRTWLSKDEGYRTDAIGPVLPILPNPTEGHPVPENRRVEIIMMISDLTLGIELDLSSSQVQFADDTRRPRIWICKNDEPCERAQAQLLLEAGSSCTIYFRFATPAKSAESFEFDPPQIMIDEGDYPLASIGFAWTRSDMVMETHTPYGTY